MYSTTLMKSIVKKAASGCSQPFYLTIPLRLYCYLSVLMRQSLYLLWADYSIVDADVVDQAGEVGSGFHSLACADV